MPATPLFQNDIEPSSPDPATVSELQGPDPLKPSGSTAEDSLPALISLASDPATTAGDDDYTRLQRRLIQATLIVSALAVAFTALTFDPHTAGCLLVGSLAGVLYLRLLARSVARLGHGSKKVGKLQLLVPVVLVLASARLPQLDLLPALIGFLLYKPALILQALVDR